MPTEKFHEQKKNKARGTVDIMLQRRTYIICDNAEQEKGNPI